MKTLTTFALALCLSAGLLTGCNSEPQMFGMPQSQWQTLSPKQQKSVIKGYNHRKQIETQNAPLTDAIGAVQNAVNNQQFMNRH
jgi:hypothetical protein